MSESPEGKGWVVSGREVLGVGGNGFKGRILTAGAGRLGLHLIPLLSVRWSHCRLSVVKHSKLIFKDRHNLDDLVNLFNKVIYSRYFGSLVGHFS